MKVQKKNLRFLWLLFGFISGGIFGALSYFEIFSIQASLFWGLLAILVGISLMVLSVLWLSLLLFAQSVANKIILRIFKGIIFAGTSLFLIGLCLLAGIYLHHVRSGLMEGKWILFWPMIISACIIFWIGIYFKIGTKNFETFQRWKGFLRREDAEPHAFLKYMRDEIILQRQLLAESRLRWVRHIMIYWGFVLLFLADIHLAFVNDFLPVFGWSQFSQPDNVVRLTLDFALDFFGLMILAGTSIALVRAYLVRGTDERIYNDTLTSAFLFVVVFSGYLLEGFRLAAETYQPYMAYSFVGNFIATFLRAKDLSMSSTHKGLWLFHVILSCIFIAYFPVKRLIHSCATPIGKLMQSQKLMLDRKVTGVASGLISEEEL
jgi:nitrate reductase gamma subunit